MSALGRRLTALEEIAEEVRTRPIRRMLADLAAECRLGPEQAEVMIREGIEMTDRLAAERDARLRAGCSERQILADYAERLGVPVEQIQREAAEIADRYFRG